jgi:hypothetical protein
MYTFDFYGTNDKKKLDKLFFLSFIIKGVLEKCERGGSFAHFGFLLD